MAEHYFQDNELQAEGLANLRLCQAEALQALKDFVPHDEDGARKRGLVVLPTGTVRLRIAKHRWKQTRKLFGILDLYIDERCGSAAARLNSLFLVVNCNQDLGYGLG